MAGICIGAYQALPFGWFSSGRHEDKHLKPVYDAVFSKSASLYQDKVLSLLNRGGQQAVSFDSTPCRAIFNVAQVQSELVDRVALARATALALPFGASPFTDRCRVINSQRKGHFESPLGRWVSATA